MTLYLKDATHVDWQTTAISKTHLAVAEGAKGGLEFVDRLPAAEQLRGADRVLDCAGKLVTRAFGCGHHHIYSTMARGMPAPARTPSNFHEILQYIWWTVDKALDREMIEASACLLYTSDAADDLA